MAGLAQKSDAASTKPAGAGQPNAGSPGEHGAVSMAQGGKHVHAGVEATTEPTSQPTTARPPAGRALAVPKMTHGTLWVVQGQFVKPIKVRVGPTDSTNTEVQPVNPDELTDGTQLVVDQQKAGEGAQNGAVNPFTPQIRRTR